MSGQYSVIHAPGSRWYGSVAFGAARDSIDEHLVFPWVASFRPFVWDADESALPNSGRFWNTTSAHPGTFPDAPWYDDLGLDPDDFGLSQMNAIAWDGVRKKCYIVAPTLSPIFGGTAPNQNLYVCDEFFAGATRLKQHWRSVPEVGFDDSFEVVDMVHFKTPDHEGLCVYSVSASAESSQLRFFDLNGDDAGLADFGLFWHDNSRDDQDILYLARGDDSQEEDNGAAFGTVLFNDYTGGGHTLTNREYRVAAFPNNNYIYQPGSFSVSGSSRYHLGQPTFDFVQRRVLVPHQELSVSSGSITQTASKIVQLTIDSPGGGWNTGNVTASDLITFPTDTFDLGGEGIILAKTEPMVAWVNGLDEKIYVWLRDNTQHDDPAALYGIVRYDLDGTNPEMVCDDVFIGRFTDFGEPHFAGNAVAFGPGMRAPWEL